MRDLVLYGNLESGHSYKARLFLTLADVPHRYVPVDLDVPRGRAARGVPAGQPVRRGAGAGR